LMLRPCQFRKSCPPGLAALALPLFAAGPPVVFALFGQTLGRPSFAKLADWKHLAGFRGSGCAVMECERIRSIMRGACCGIGANHGFNPAARECPAYKLSARFAAPDQENPARSCAYNAHCKHADFFM
jgi:hypothetical protein